MSCAWNDYCKMVKESIAASELMISIGKNIIEKASTPFERICGERLCETALYYYLDGMLFERDNYITVIGEDMEKNGDDWIYYMARQLQDKHLFEWLRVYNRIPFELKKEWKSKIREEDYKYEKRAGRI